MKLLPQIRMSFRKSSQYEISDHYQHQRQDSQNSQISQQSLDDDSMIRRDGVNTHKRSSSSILFPDGKSSDFYGLPPINKLKDVDTLRRFEVIRYLEGFDIGYEYDLSDSDLKNTLKTSLELKNGRIQLSV